MEPPKTLSRQAIEEFKTIFLEEFGDTISDEEAQNMALRLLRAFELIYQLKPPSAS